MRSGLKVELSTAVSNSGYILEGFEILGSGATGNV